MGDISEMRGLLVVGSFITITVLLIGWMPSQLYSATETQRTVIPPTYFEAIDLTSFAETWSNNIDNGSYTVIGTTGWYIQTDVDGDADGDFGGYDIDLYSNDGLSKNGRIVIRWIWYWWVFITGSKDLDWYDVNGFECSEPYQVWTTITGDTLNADYTEHGKLEYNVKSGSFTIKVFFNFNTTTYNDPVSAWNNQELYIFLGIDFDQTQTTYNAWDVIGMVLFFKMPNTYWMLNAVIAVPIWICVAYLAFILTLRAIGAIFGGGA